MATLVFSYTLLSLKTKMIENLTQVEAEILDLKNKSYEFVKSCYKVFLY
jgi:hypothetical protein